MLQVKFYKKYKSIFSSLEDKKNILILPLTHFVKNDVKDINYIFIIFRSVTDPHYDLFFNGTFLGIDKIGIEKLKNKLKNSGRNNLIIFDYDNAYLSNMGDLTYYEYYKTIEKIFIKNGYPFEIRSIMDNVTRLIKCSKKIDHKVRGDFEP